MIVVVESNFVLELAFRQEEIAEAERIIDLATNALASAAASRDGRSASLALQLLTHAFEAIEVSGR
jgi:hypothetical protein